nr:putative integron gene cassette protein [uncultured bacterium]
MTSSDCGLHLQPVQGERKLFAQEPGHKRSAGALACTELVAMTRISELRPSQSLKRSPPQTCSSAA